MAMASAAGPHRAATPVAVTGGLAALPPPAAVVRRPPAPLLAPLARAPPLLRRIQALPRLRRPTLAEVRYVSSASMAPTLRPADRAVAEKEGELHVPAAICERHRLLQGAPPCKCNCGINKDVVFIKRVIATPGDFIQVRQGQLIVNGVAQNEHYTAQHVSSYTMEAMVQRYLYAQTTMGHYYYTNK